MRNYFAALAALLLIAAAVFLPGELAQWNDTALLDEPHILRQGESLVMPANIPHAVYGAERFKMLLTVVF